MHARIEAITNTRYDRSFSIASASRPRMRPIVTCWPRAGGGVWGSADDAVEAHHHAGARRDEKRRRHRFDGHEADHQIHGNPAKRAHHANRREITAGIFHLLHRDRVRQRDGGEVAETECQQQAEHAGETS